VQEPHGINKKHIKFGTIHTHYGLLEIINLGDHIREQVANLNVRHYIGIYTIRKRMQDEGITNPSEKIKKFTTDFVEKLKNIPLEEEIILKGNSFYDSKGNLIINF